MKYGVGIKLEYGVVVTRQILALKSWVQILLFQHRILTLFNVEYFHISRFFCIFALYGIFQDCCIFIQNNDLNLN